MALSFSKNDMLRGPGSIWFDVPIPAPGSGVSVDQDGKPTTGGYLAGYTRSGWDWTLGMERPAEEAWPGQEALSVVAPTSMSISAEVVELRNILLLQLMIPSMYYVGSPARRFTLGSPRRPDAFPSVLCVFRQTDQRTLNPNPQPKQYGYVMLYRCINIEDFGFHVTRLDYASARFRFQGRPIYDRPPEDQIGHVQMYAAPIVSVLPAPTQGG